MRQDEKFDESSSEEEGQAFYAGGSERRYMRSQYVDECAVKCYFKFTKEPKLLVSFRLHFILTKQPWIFWQFWIFQIG